MKLKGAFVLAIIAMVVMTPMVASAGKSLALTTDKSAYEIGEAVVITVENKADEAVMIPGGYNVLDVNGKVVYEAPTPLFMPPLAPGDSITYTWDQIDNCGNAVVPGDYTIQTSYDTATFKIFDSSETSSKAGIGRAIGIPGPGRATQISA